VINLEDDIEFAEPENEGEEVENQEINEADEPKEDTKEESVAKEEDKEKDNDNSDPKISELILKEPRLEILEPHDPDEESKSP
jgi:hypothetical protein